MNKKLKQQAGGTLLGLILGLIIGLGIAVGVALMISKTPLPFTNKATPSDRINSQTGEPVDPNKSMYSKRAAPPVTTGVDPAPPSSTVTEDSVKAQPVERVSPGTQKAEAAAKAEDADEKWIYYLQAGAFRERADAESMRAKLALIGLEANISERQAETGTLHRVRVGPFGQMETMNRVRTKLSDNGIDVAVVRIGK
ncbi:SPOR domain-containing protein [Oxalicibacterium faecigallinarum]|uniref:Exported protein n=1 Tax=Oxalicibacterium faecigallinarum TaxID=573741 RepID=A0A8J3APU4_9BURK|nr:SPOR domain-containing protein [Oxalicibacterium faecigallinarum]GGI18976.1 exported protein [Oxalicibacterium faecigallinarum]